MIGEYELNKIHCTDCIFAMKKIPDNSFDIIIIDPPYNIWKEFWNDSDKQEMSDYIERSQKWIHESFRILSKTGTIYIYWFSEILAHISVNIKFPKRWLIWHYTNKNIPSLNFWQRSHEAIICTRKDKPIFNRDLVREPYTKWFLNGSAWKIRTATWWRFNRGNKETIYFAHENWALPRDVIKVSTLAWWKWMNERVFYCKNCKCIFFSKEKHKHNNHNTVIHPTQKPSELTKKLILSSYHTNKTTKILVPFAWSWSECKVAKDLWLNFLWFEINPDYVKLGNGLLDYK